MNNENFKEVQELIALKRHEQPDDAYFEEFLDEFHRRQRQDLLQRSSRSLFFERMSTWFTGMNKWNLVLGGGAAYAALMLGFFFMPKGDAPVPELNTAPVEHVKPLDVPVVPKEDMLTPDKDKEPVHEAY